MGRRKQALVEGRGRRLLAAAVLALLGGCVWKGGVAENSRETAGEQPCRAVLAGTGGDSALLEADLQRRVESFQVLAENALAQRAEAISVSRQAVRDAAPGAPLPPALMDELRLSMKGTVDAVAPVEAVLDGNLCWVEMDELHTARHGLPAVPPGVRTRGVMLALAASLTLYDTYLATAAVLNEDKRIRRFLDSCDIGYGMDGDQLHALSVQMTSITNLSYMRQLTAYYRDHRTDVEALALEHKDAAYLMLLIDQSPALEILRDGGDDEVLARRMDGRAQRLLDNLQELNRRGMGGLSKVFGNTVGLFESRVGKLRDDGSAYATLREALRPGDIILEKTPFRLTDKLIPGYFGHAALWLGDEADLRALGIWDHPAVQPHQPALQEERQVLEALRGGVQMNTLAHFMNVDDLVVLRDPRLTERRLRGILVRGFRQVGKRYDFNFDVDTTDRIACAELIYLAHADIPWQADRKAGRYTLSPDRIAELAVDPGQFEVVLLYIGGTQVRDDPRGALRQRLDHGNSGAPYRRRPPGTRGGTRRQDAGLASREIDRTPLIPVR